MQTETLLSFISTNPPITSKFCDVPSAVTYRIFPRVSEETIGACCGKMVKEPVTPGRVT